MFVVGERGLQKSSIVSIIHQKGPYAAAPLADVDCEKIDPAAAGSVFEGGDGASELLHWLSDGTLLLNNVHRVRSARHCRPLPRHARHA